MPVKIRLSRKGKKGKPFYHILVADSRAPRDGRFIEKIGTYNPNTNPASIDLEFDKAVDWLQKGAQPTETARAILSYKGVMLKKHLLEGVKKGAFDEAEAEKRFEAWSEDKAKKIQAKIDMLMNESASDKAKRLADEQKVKEARAAEIAKKTSELAVEAAEATEATAEAQNEVEEAPQAPEAAAEVTEVVPEVKAEEAAAEIEVKTEEAAPEVEAKAEEAAPEVEAKAEEAAPEAEEAKEEPAKEDEEKKEE